MDSQIKLNLDVIHPFDSDEYAFVLSNIPNHVNEVVITGGHGNEKKPGVLGDIDHKGMQIEQPEHLVSFFFPDCYLGTEESINILSEVLGVSSEIHAFNFATSELSVYNFLTEMESGGASAEEAFHVIKKALNDKTRNGDHENDC